MAHSDEPMTDDGDYETVWSCRNGCHSLDIEFEQTSIGGTIVVYVDVPLPGGEMLALCGETTIGEILETVASVGSSPWRDQFFLTLRNVCKPGEEVKEPSREEHQLVLPRVIAQALYKRFFH